MVVEPHHLTRLANGNLHFRFFSCFFVLFCQLISCSSILLPYPCRSLPLPTRMNLIGQRNRRSFSLSTGKAGTVFSCQRWYPSGEVGFLGGGLECLEGMAWWPVIAQSIRGNCTTCRANSRPEVSSWVTVPSCRRVPGASSHCSRVSVHWSQAFTGQTPLLKVWGRGCCCVTTCLDKMGDTNEGIWTCKTQKSMAKIRGAWESEGIRR